MEPPAPRRDRTAIFAVSGIAVAIVVLGAAAYVMLTGPGSPAAPDVLLSDPPWRAGSTVLVNVTRASPEMPLDRFRADFRDITGSRMVFSVVLTAGSLYQEGAAAATFSDAGATGVLSIGDGIRFVGFPAGATYSLTLVYVPEARSLASVTIPL